MTTAAESLLATSLDKLPFPTRMQNFIERRGLTTVRDLLLFTPTALTLEPNLGRKSVADTREVLRRHLGVAWEVARSAFVVPPGTSSPPPGRTPAEEWASLRTRLPQELLDSAVDAHDDVLPARLQTFAAKRKLPTIAALVALDYDELGRAQGIGAGTLRATFDFLRRRCTLPDLTIVAPAVPPVLREVEDPLPPGATWRSVLQASLRELPSNERLILTQRSGLAGPIPTLAELGECLGVSRERIRQLESRALERVQRAPWVEPAKSRFDQAATAPLTLLASWQPNDALFALTEPEVDAFSFFVNDVLESAARLFKVEDTYVLSRVERSEIDARLDAVRQHARLLAYPLPKGEHLAVLAHAAGRPTEEITAVAALFDDEWIVENGVVTGFGMTKRDAIVAFVRAAKRPVAKTELEERFGRVLLPDEMVFVDHGLVTLPETIPDWERWRRRIPPTVRSLLEKHGPERQWTTYELVPLLAEEADLPAWFNEWTLGSLLKDAPDVRYLGRNVVALTGPVDGRMLVHELVVATLHSAGKPLEEDKLLESLHEKRGFGPHTWAVAKMQRPILLFEDGRVGLMPRDVEGGLPAIEKFCDAVFARLDERQAGLRGTELRGLLVELGDPMSVWDTRLARSILRHDGRFRSAPGGAVGLSEWEDVRTPSQREVLEELMIEHDGVVPFELALNELPTMSGEPLSRNRIGLLANSIRARLVGPFIEWIPEAGEPSSDKSSLAGRVLSALPEDTVGIFRELLSNEPSADDLALMLKDWLTAMREQAPRNANIELEQVERLGAQANVLLDRLLTNAAADAKPLYSAAIRYLTSIHDATSDTALGGLDDDELVLETVLSTCRVAPSPLLGNIE